MTHAQPANSCALSDEADTHLIALGIMLERAWAEERASGGSEDAIDTASAIADLILRIQAKTLSGVIVKARAVAWCYGDEEVAFTGVARTTDMQLAESIVLDLLCMVRAGPIARPPLKTMPRPLAKRQRGPGCA